MPNNHSSARDSLHKAWIVKVFIVWERPFSKCGNNCCCLLWLGLATDYLQTALIIQNKSCFGKRNSGWRKKWFHSLREQFGLESVERYIGSDHPVHFKIPETFDRLPYPIHLKTWTAFFSFAYLFRKYAHVFSSDTSFHERNRQQGNAQCIIARPSGVHFPRPLYLKNRVHFAFGRWPKWPAQIRTAQNIVQGARDSYPFFLPFWQVDEMVSAVDPESKIPIEHVCPAPEPQIQNTKQK